jgi:hypothetical protein
VLTVCAQKEAVQADVDIAIGQFIKQEGLTGAARDEVLSTHKLLREQVRARGARLPLVQKAPASCDR